MAWDAGLAQCLRADLAALPVVEKKIFGGLAFLLNGHMVCVAQKGGAMFRVGNENEAAALAVPGAATVTMGDRPMRSMVGLSGEAASDDARRGRLMAMALAVGRALPPK